MRRAEDGGARAAAPGGIVTSPHRGASEAGLAILRQGGNAIEAAIAISSMLAVGYPHFCGLGGDAIWIVAGPGEAPRCFMAIGQAARDCAELRSIPLRGPGSTLTTACLVDSWRHALEFSADRWAGRFGLPGLLEHAIDCADRGYATTPSQAFWLDFRREEIAGWPGFGDVFLPSGTPPEIGSLFRQPQLAGSLREIARHGPRDFYEGGLARRIARGLAEKGSPLRGADLAATRTREAGTISLDYGGLVLHAPPPPTQGVTTLAIMAVLAQLDRAGVAEGSADDYHLVVEAIKQAFLDRGDIADPDFVPQAPASLLAPERIAAKAAAIHPRRSMAWPAPLRTGDTVFFSAIDGAGRAASVLQSIYYDWGSGVVAGDTGVLWQNRGGAFSTLPGHPNVVSPGKRPFYTLNPGIAMADGIPRLTYGTQGADGQPQTLAVLLTRLLDYGLSPAEALRRPRFLLGRTFSDSRDSLKIEEDVGAAVTSELERRGHEVSPLAALSPLVGQAGILARDVDGTLCGAHDPRSDGCALRL